MFRPNGHRSVVDRQDGHRGDAGGIRSQVVNHQTGFLVSTSEGAALHIRYLLKHNDRLLEVGLIPRLGALKIFRLIHRRLRRGGSLTF
jgi:hypothetical protein